MVWCEDSGFDWELVDLLFDLCWWEWMCWIEVVLFVSGVLVLWDYLVWVVGLLVLVDLLIEDLIVDLEGCFYEVV